MRRNYERRSPYEYELEYLVCKTVITIWKRGNYERTKFSDDDVLCMLDKHKTDCKEIHRDLKILKVSSVKTTK